MRLGRQQHCMGCILLYLFGGSLFTPVVNKHSKEYRIKNLCATTVELKECVFSELAHTNQTYVPETLHRLWRWAIAAANREFVPPECRHVEHRYYS